MTSIGQHFICAPVETAEAGGCSAYVHLPPNAKELGPLPISIQIHGGGHIAGCSREVAPDSLSYLLESGFAVVGLGYRLLPQVSVDDQRQDLIDGYAWVLNTLPGLVDVELDTDRIFATGSSAGATLAAYFTNDILHPPSWMRLPTTPSPLPPLRASILIYGMFEFSKAFEPVSGKVLRAVQDVAEQLGEELKDVGEVSSVPFETFETTKDPVLLLRHKFGAVFGSLLYVVHLDETEYPSTEPKVDPKAYMSRLLFPKSSHTKPDGTLLFDDFLGGLHSRQPSSGSTSSERPRTTPIGFLNATLDTLVLPKPNSVAYHRVLKEAGVETELWDVEGDHAYDFHNPDSARGGSIWAAATEPALNWAIGKTRR